MKTWKKIVLLIGILLLAFGLTALQIAHHRGESFATGLAGLNGFGMNSRVHLDYDQKGYTVLKDGEESFSAGEVEALQIDWISGGVSVQQGPRSPGEAAHRPRPAEPDALGADGGRGLRLRRAARSRRRRHDRSGFRLRLAARRGLPLRRAGS